LGKTGFTGQGMIVKRGGGRVQREKKKTLSNGVSKRRGRRLWGGANHEG